MEGKKITNLHIVKNIIRCPECGSSNLHDEINGLKCSDCSEFYPIQEGVPQLITEKHNASQQSHIHKDFGSNFQYLDHYRKDAEVYDYFQEQHGVVGHSDRRLREYIISKAPKQPGLVLDVGCGSAWVAKSFCQKGFQVVSFDISPRNTAEALKRFPSENHAAVVGDVFSLPFKNYSFDFIIASEIIEHVTEPDTFIKNLLGVLKPGGTLIVSTPYKEKIEYSLCIHCNRPTPKSAHLHSFDENILLNLYSGSDIKNVDFFTFGNKALVFLRFHIILKWFGFGLWKIIDKIANLLYKRPLNILVRWRKKPQ